MQGLCHDSPARVPWSETNSCRVATLSAVSVNIYPSVLFLIPPSMKSLPSLPAKSGRQRVATHGTDEKRERILDAAEQLFAAQGYANTTVEQIVQALGVT